MSLRPSRVLLLLALGAFALAHGAWDDRFMGLPALEFFRSSETHAPGFYLCMTQDEATGRLYAGTGGGVLSFDGRTWRKLTADTTQEYRSLAFDAATSRLWFGAAADLGYFEIRETGEAARVSLRDRLPFPPSELATVWRCQVGNGTVDFVARDRVLRWDGKQFTVWTFPSASRLYPVSFEGSLWFHHMETGLYRLGPAGPEFVAPRENMPAKGIFLLQRRDGALLAVSSAGIRSIEATPRSLATPETDRFLQTGKVTCATALSDDFTFISTIESGSAVIDRSGRLLKIIDEVAGFSARCFGHFVDRDRAIWVFDGQTVARIQAPGSIARVFAPTLSSEGFIDSLLVENDASVWFSQEGQICVARPTEQPERGLSFTLLPAEKRHYSCVLPTPHGMILAHQGALELQHEQQTTLLANLPATDTWSIAPSRNSADRYFLNTALGFAELNRSPAGQWSFKRYDPLAAATGDARTLAEDEHGGVWLGSISHNVTYLRPDRDGFTLATPKALATQPASQSSQVFRRPHDTLLIIDGALYRATAGGEPRSLDYRLPPQAYAAAISADGQRLYVTLPHPEAPQKFSFSIGVVEFAAPDRVQRLRALVIPALHTIGDPRALAVTSEHGTDTLWIGGSTGLIQARASELPEWQPPQPPALSLLDGDAPATRTDFSSLHQLRFHLRTQEISLRPALRFQTRLGDDAWSTATELTSREFSNLREGTYTFSARTVNPLGQTSAPVMFTFTIQPPWYRSPWAYAGYLLLCGAGIYSTMRYREGRIRARAEELEKIVAERTADLVKANAAKDEFLASMSHEIRNPMNGVVGLSAAIDTAHLDDEGRHRFALLRHCASHLASLLEDILDFSKLQSGTIELDPQPFVVSELLDAVSAITSPASAHVGVPVEIALGPSVPPRLTGDARRIRQVLLNYVTNALKYAPHGQIDLTVWARPAKGGRVSVTFAVTDMGAGIPASEHERIFEKFERGAGARSNHIPGTGMGLAVCRKLAVAMGGRAWVESEPGEGATFFLELELPIATATPLPLAATIALGAARRALVVDDEEYNAVALGSMLSRCGFTVARALRASEAMALLATQHHDIIFLDYDMPDATGPQLARRIREFFTSADQQPLIIATTAYTTVGTREECLAAGMNDFLSKPITEERLQQVLAENLLHEPPTPGNSRTSAPVSDPLRNLRRLAQQRTRALETELAEFAHETSTEFAELDVAIQTADPVRVARAAHRLTGRLGFVSAHAALARVRQLEEFCRLADWPEAQRAREDAGREWADFQLALTRLTSAPAA